MSTASDPLETPESAELRARAWGALRAARGQLRHGEQDLDSGWLVRRGSDWEVAADAPPVYRDVKALPDGSVIAEFPFGDPAWEIRAVYYAAIHGKPIVNGYSGAFPPGYRRRMAALQRFKEDGELAWQALLAAKTTHVIVRVRAFATPSEGLAVLAWLDAHGARQVSAYEEGAVLFAVPR